MDSQAEVQESEIIGASVSSHLPLANHTNVSSPTETDDQRRYIHGMLYGGPDHERNSLDNNSKLNSKMVTATTYQNSIPSKNSLKQPIMNRSATSENAISATNKENDSGFVHIGSTVNSAAMSLVHRPQSGNDHIVKHAHSSANVDIPDKQNLQNYDSPTYHSRHATHIYKGGPSQPTGSVSNQTRPGQGAAYRDQSSSSATNLMKNVLSTNNNNMASILISAGQYASQAVANNQHHIPIRNPANNGQMIAQSGPNGSNILMNRGSSQQSNHHPQMLLVGSQSNLSQQQIQQQQYKTAKTQMYEKMILQQQPNIVASSNIDKKALLFATAGSSFNTSAQMNGLQNQQQQFIQNQTFNQQAMIGQMTGIPQSLIFPRITNIRNEAQATVGGVSGSIYKTNQGSNSQGPQGSMSQYHLQMQQQNSAQNSNLQSPFVQSGKAPAILMPSPGQAILGGGTTTNYNIAKKKTVSPRNGNPQNGFFNSHQTNNGPKMLLMADKNQQLLDMAQGRPQEDMKGSMVLSSDNQDSNSKMKNRIQNGTNKNGQEMIDNADFNGLSGKYSGIINEDSTQKGTSNGAVNQFFCGEMSINGDYP